MIRMIVIWTEKKAVIEQIDKEVTYDWLEDIM
jgi:hypothetical protein